MDPGSCVFIGWQDEGHDRNREDRERDIARARAAFDDFNQSNDPAALNCLI
jgi:hypothetical protein